MADSFVAFGAGGRGALDFRAADFRAADRCAARIFDPPGTRIRWPATRRSGSTPSFQSMMAASGAEWRCAIVHRLSPATTTWVGPMGRVAGGGWIGDQGVPIARCSGSVAAVSPASGLLGRHRPDVGAGDSSAPARDGGSIRTGVRTPCGTGDHVDGGTARTPSPGRGTRNAAPMARMATTATSTRGRTAGRRG